MCGDRPSNDLDGSRQAGYLTVVPDFFENEPLPAWVMDKVVSSSAAGAPGP